MVRKKTKTGAEYHEPPYTPEEDADFYRRVGGGPLAFTRPGPPRPADPARLPGEQPGAKRQRSPRGTSRSQQRERRVHFSRAIRFHESSFP